MRAALLAAVAALGVACAALGPADRAAIAEDAAKIERCQEIGRACKADGGTNCFGQYAACMRDGGLR